MHRFYFRHMPLPTFKAAAIAGLGATLMIVAVFYLGDLFKSQMVVASFGATAVLLFATPASPVSQPINVIAGHFVSALVGLVLAWLMADSHWLAGLSVGLSISVMMLLRIVNPPAGATGLVAYLTHPGWLFLVFPVLLGTIALIVIASIFHHIRGVEYPLMPK